MEYPLVYRALSEPANGRIALCPYQACGYRCCEFQQGNYIVLYPGELEAAIGAGISVQHLQVTEQYNGGFKAVCTAGRTATCDNGYKPLDCKSYPYFPTIKNGQIHAGLKGKKCPLTPGMTRTHAQFVEKEWRHLAEQIPTITDWLSKVTLVGYESVDDK